MKAKEVYIEHFLENAHQAGEIVEEAMGFGE